jgi:uncharacterized membrane protein
VTFTLVDGLTRGLLLAAAVALSLVAVWRARTRHPRSAAFAGALAVAALGTVGLEAAVALLVRWDAPAGTQFNEYRWVVLSPWGRLGFVLGGLAVVLIVLLAWRGTRGARPGRRIALIALRGGASLCALAVFVQPAIELRQVASDPNHIAILVDDSASMGLHDGQGAPTRLEHARALLETSAVTLERWQQKHKLDFFTFSETLTATTRDTAARGQAVGTSSQIGKALELVRSRYDGFDLAGVVLISDGAATGSLGDGTGEGAVKDFLRSLETRVHTVWAARPGLKDVAIASVRADEFAFVRTVVRIDVVVKATGYQASHLPLTLLSDGEPLREKWVDVPAGGETTVTFEVTPPRVGRYVYEVSTPVLDDEAVPSNNRRAFVLRVIRDKIRVLQVSGQPSWDMRALRQMLKANPNVDLISFFILRTQDDISLVPDEEMSLIPFPTRELFEEELPSFDLIILQNFEFLPYGIGDYLENIRAYVDGGGGLIMLGGEQSFSSGGYFATPIAAALPVDLVPGTTADHELLDTTRFAARLTEVGKRHPVTSLRYSAADNAQAWKQLPALEGVNLVAGARPGASVLAVHPQLSARGKPMPVIVAGDYGQGRSLAVTTDTLWRWGFVAAGQPTHSTRHYDKFWDGAIRWLIQDPDLRNLQIDTDAGEYAPKAAIRVQARLLDREYQPKAGGKVKLVVRQGAAPRTAVRIATAEITVGEDGTGSYELAGLAPGIYRVEGTSTIADHVVTASDIFLVRDGGLELARPTGDQATLELIASATGGTALGAIDTLPPSLSFDAPRVIRVDDRSDVELWNRPTLLVLVILMLAGEWLLRQRSGYL